MASQGEGKLGANQYLPRTAKKSRGKGSTGWGRRGGKRRFYWATLTLVRASLESGQIKAYASFISLDHAGSPGGLKSKPVGRYMLCPEFRDESASWDQIAGPSLAAHQYA